MMELTIVIPFYKGKNYLDYWQVCLEKNFIFLQTSGMFIKCEVLFINDYPEEDIVIQNKIKEKLNIKIYNLPENRGIHGARIFGCKKASGKYILFLDQDDKITDNYILSQMKHIGENDAVVCNGYHERFCMSGKKFLYGSEIQHKKAVSIDTLLYKGNGLISPGQVVIKKESIPEIWLNNIMKVNGADDYFLWIAMLKENRKFGINKDILYTHVGHGDNTSGDINIMHSSIEEMVQILERHNVLNEEECRVFRKRISNERSVKEREMVLIYDYWMHLKINGRSLAEYFKKKEYHNIAIYGMNYLGSRLCDELKNSSINVMLGIDKEAKRIQHEVPVYELDEAIHSMDNIEVIVVTAISYFEEIKKDIEEKCDILVVSMKDILVEMCKELQSNQAD